MSSRLKGGYEFTPTKESKLSIESSYTQVEEHHREESYCEWFCLTFCSCCCSSTSPSSPVQRADSVSNKLLETGPAGGGVSSPTEIDILGEEEEPQYGLTKFCAAAVAYLDTHFCIWVRPTTFVTLIISCVLQTTSVLTFSGFEHRRQLGLQIVVAIVFTALQLLWLIFSLRHVFHQIWDLGIRSVCEIYITFVVVFAGFYHMTYCLDDATFNLPTYMDWDAQQFGSRFRVFIWFFYFSSSQQTLCGVCPITPTQEATIFFSGSQMFVGIIFSVFIISIAMTNLSNSWTPVWEKEMDLENDDLSIAPTEDYSMISVGDEEFQPSSFPSMNQHIQDMLIHQPNHGQIMKKDRSKSESYGPRYSVQYPSLSTTPTANLRPPNGGTPSFLNVPPPQKRNLHRPTQSEAIFNVRNNQQFVFGSSHRESILGWTQTSNNRHHRRVSSRRPKSWFYKFTHNRCVVRCRRLIRRFLLVVIAVIQLIKLIVAFVLQEKMVDVKSRTTIEIVMSFVVIDLLQILIIMTTSTKFVHPEYTYSVKFSFLIQAYLSVVIAFLGIYMDLKLIDSKAFSVPERGGQHEQDFWKFVAHFFYFSFAIMTLCGSGLNVLPNRSYSALLVCMQMFLGVGFHIIIFGLGLLKIVFSRAMSLNKEVNEGGTGIDSGHSRMASDITTVLQRAAGNNVFDPDL